MYQRLFQLEQEWCMIHYPERPNGFAVMIIGDSHHYVDGKSSFWVQHEARYKWIQDLTSKGYIVYYSNLYGANWGSDQAVQLARRLYQHVKRNEIINGKIHILAEGMGALVLKKLYPKLENDIRSAVMLSPCVSLYDHLEQEKEQKFFYKKVIKELSQVLKVKEEECEAFILQRSRDYEIFKAMSIPLYIVQSMTLNRYKNQFTLIKDIYTERLQKGTHTDLFIVLPEKRGSLGRKFSSYFSLHEKEL
ncbi:MULTISPECIES: hydrolase [Bacillaceae]|uniref:hydrolase n=1 Tax=Bacillaceae TaxID=186817 RepID=UPI001C59FF31|nr:hydrolase [Rossellomorea sp. YZS02]MBW3111972.1 hydrolase [Bacillus sp. MCCB 382]MDX8346094.1 hydrolase [Rossellomorea sp. YZS02]